MLDRIYKGCQTTLCKSCESNHYNQQNDYWEHVEFPMVHKECKDFPDCTESVHEPYNSTLFINHGSISKRQISLSIARNLCPTKIKLTVKDYFALPRSRKKMTKRLTAKAIRYAMGQIKKGTSSSSVAVQISVTPWHVRRLWAEFCATGSPHIPRMPRRPATQPSPDEVQLVPDEHRREDVGVLCTAMNLRKDHDIRYSKVSSHKGERTGDSVDCQISQAEVDTLRAEAFQFNMTYGLARHEGSALSRSEPHNLP